MCWALDRPVFAHCHRYGELNFVLFGVLIQLGAVLAEAFRLALVQILLGSKVCGRRTACGSV